MRNKLKAIILAVVIFIVQCVPVMGQTLFYDGKHHEYNLAPISLYVNKEKIESAMPPVQIEGRVLVPSREVFEAMKAVVDWSSANKKVTITHSSNTIILTVDKNEVLLNGEEVLTDVPSKMVNDKVMIPIRFISENLGFKVHWEQNSRSVYIEESESSLDPDSGQEDNKDESDKEDDKSEDNKDESDKEDDKGEDNKDEPDKDEVDKDENKDEVDKEEVDKEEEKEEEEDTVIPEWGTQGESEYTGSKNNHKLNITNQSLDRADITSVAMSGDTVTINASSGISDANIFLQAGKVIIDIKNSTSKLQSAISPGTNSYVSNIRTSQFTSDTTRVVLDLKAGALVQVQISADRTKLNIKLSPRAVEKISFDLSGKQEKLFLEGVSNLQINISKSGNNMELILPKAYIVKDAVWTNLKGDLIKEIKVGNRGEDVKVDIKLGENYYYDVVSDNNGTTLVFNEEQKNMTYIAGSKPTIKLSELTGLSSRTMVVNDDYRNRTLTFDLTKDYSSLLNSQTISINDNYIKEIRIVNDGTTKIVINTTTVRAYNIINNQSGVTIELVKPSEKYDKILVIDPGHGGKDPGAVGNGLSEKTVNFNQSMELYKQLSIKSDIKIYMTRETDEYPTLAFRTELANEIGADLFVSIHNNAASSNVRGAETLYYPSTSSPEGKQIAQMIQNTLVNECGMGNRGIKARSDVYVLRNTAMPAVLIETGFISNVQDAAIIGNSAFTIKWADKISNTIIEAFNLL